MRDRKKTIMVSRSSIWLTSRNCRWKSQIKEIQIVRQRQAKLLKIVLTLKKGSLTITSKHQGSRLFSSVERRIFSRTRNMATRAASTITAPKIGSFQTWAVIRTRTEVTLIAASIAWSLSHGSSQPAFSIQKNRKNDE